MFKNIFKKKKEKEIYEMETDELQKMLDDINYLVLKEFFGEKRFNDLLKLNFLDRRKKELEMIEEMSNSVKKIKIELADPKVIHNIEKLLMRFDINKHQYNSLERKIIMDSIFSKINLRNFIEDEIFKRNKKLIEYQKS